LVHSSCDTLYTVSQVRTTSCSWDKGVLTDLCLTRVLTYLRLTLYKVLVPLTRDLSCLIITFLSKLSIFSCYVLQTEASKTAVTGNWFWQNSYHQVPTKQQLQKHHLLTKVYTLYKILAQLVLTWIMDHCRRHFKVQMVYPTWVR